MTVDYKSLGLKVGLEIHQQLNTKTKLFCKCRSDLSKEEPEIKFIRKLRPTQSELGQIDPAAFFEFQKGLEILYQENEDTSCLVEMDEEPPHDLNREALESSLTASLMLEANPIDEIHVMRKTVIDGSNTTGFQRTCLIALGGKIVINGKTIQILHVGLEEDAARKIGGTHEVLIYRIDRLCIPLVEVATAPVIGTPQEAKEVALAIGRVLRATGRMKRGLGTIRQDLNISIPSGALIEIKGVQELELVSLIVENEVQRQLALLKIREDMRKRGVREDDIEDEFVDVTDVFKETKCKVIQKAIQENKKVLAAKLVKFGGILGRQLTSKIRLGTEIADRARFWGRVNGIFHTDELPGYGVTSEEANKLKRATKANPEDAVVFVADLHEKAVEALKAVNKRAKEALSLIPHETRAAKPDGSTRYMRPRPGAARMYPETDVAPIQISREYIERLRNSLPELPEQKMQRLMQDYKLNEKLSRQIIDSNLTRLFERSMKKSEAPPTLVAVTLTETVTALKREGTSVENVADEQFLDLFQKVGLGQLAKEAIPDVILWLSTHEKAKVSEAIDALNMSMLSQKELSKIVDEVIEENRNLLKERGRKALGIFIGLVMKEVRGKAKAEKVAEIVETKFKALAGES